MLLQPSPCTGRQKLEFAPFMTMAAEKGFGIADLEKSTLETV